jgi:hypothetical protein
MVTDGRWVGLLAGMEKLRNAPKIVFLKHYGKRCEVLRR